MDPLIQVLPELHGMVFQHFNFTDYKEITLVAPSWNDILGESEAMMKKVELIIDGKPCNATFERYSPFIRIEELDEIERIANSSCRRYRNVRIKGLTFSWTRDMNHFPKILEYLVSLSPTLVNLEIRAFGTLSEENEKLFDCIDLGRLKVLYLFVVTPKLTDKLLKQCSVLETLRFSNMPRNVSVSRESFPSLDAFLERNRSLKSIEIRGYECYDLFFDKDVSEKVEFRLKNLDINYVTLTESVNAAENCLKFIAKQSQSLERLVLQSYCENRHGIVEHIFNKMPVLKSVWIDMKFKTENLQLNLNESIVELFFERDLSCEGFKKIIPAVPKLTKLFVRNLTKEKVDIIARYLPGLQTLQYGECQYNDDGEPVWINLWPCATYVKKLAVYIKSLEKGDKVKSGLSRTFGEIRILVINK